MLRDAILGIPSQGTLIMQVWRNFNEDQQKLIGIETSRACCRKYEQSMRLLHDFIKEKTGQDDMSVKKIDPSFIDQYSLYLKADCKYAHNTANKHLQRFKRIVLLALRNGWITQNPFFGFKLSMQETDRPYLDEKELHAVMSYDFKSKRLERVRDFFIFSCFTGLAYADIKKLKKGELEHNELGYWIKTKRQKTGGRSNIPLLDVPMSIIRKYATLDLMHDYEALLPIMSNQKMNAYLKEIRDLCGISKDMSFHTARHTFATTVTLTNGVPIESVSKMLGHRNITSTQIYARIVDKKVGEDMELLAQKLNRKLTLTR